MTPHENAVDTLLILGACLLVVCIVIGIIEAGRPRR